MKEKIISLDPKFDFTSAYKKSHSLVNVEIISFHLSYSFTVNGVKKSLSWPDPLYRIAYRGFTNTNASPCEVPGNCGFVFFDSAQEATKWFNENLTELGVEPLTEDQAFREAEAWLGQSR